MQNFPNKQAILESINASVSCSMLATQSSRYVSVYPTMIAKTLKSGHAAIAAVTMKLKNLNIATFVVS